MNINEFGARVDEPFDDNGEKQRRKPSQKKCSPDVIISRAVISCLLAILLIVSLSWTWLFSVVYGPSETYRDELVARTMSKSSTKWIPYLVLPASEIDAIMQDAEVIE